MAKKIPNIRFKGFEGEWEEKKFGEKLNSTPYKEYIKTPTRNGKYPVIQQGDKPIIGYADGIPITNYSDKVIFGDHTVSLYKPISPFFAATDGLRIFSMEGISQSLLYALFERFKPESHGYTRHTSYLNESTFSITQDEDEQLKIGEFFQQLDELIGAKEQELEKLRQMKLALLDKMFPNEEEIAPPIRFKGFTEKWLKIRLRDMFDFSLPHYSHSRDQLNYHEGDVQNVHYGDILIRYGEVIRAESDSIPFITSERSDNYKNAKLLDGDIIFADTAEDETCGKAVEITNIGGRTIIAGLHTFVARPKKDFGSKYLGYFFNSNAFHNQLLPLMQGTKVLSVSKPSVEDTFIFFPLAIQEQRLIGDFFRSQDEAINSSKEEIAKLRTLKQACLQQMFA